MTALNFMWAALLVVTLLAMLCITLRDPEVP